MTGRCSRRADRVLIFLSSIFLSPLRSSYDLGEQVAGYQVFVEALADDAHFVEVVPALGAEM